MAKILTVTSFGTEVRTSKAGKSYEVFALKGTSTFQGVTQEYSRDIMKSSLRQNPALASDIAAIVPGAVVSISYDTTAFKNIDRIIASDGKAPVASAPKTTVSTPATGGSSFKAKEFKLTDESVRIGAMQIAIAEAPGKPLNLKRVTELLAIIRTGVGIETTATIEDSSEVEAEVDTNDKPF